jgi:predicted GNAT family acetyltransferase
MQKSELVSIRDGIEDDRSFIFATVLRGLYYGDSWYSTVPKSIFMSEYHKVVEHILDNPKTQIKVACLKDDPEVILGYSLLNENNTICHFTFIKKAFRGIGISRDLVPTTVTSATHLTKVGHIIAKKRGVEFNPFLI